MDRACGDAGGTTNACLFEVPHRFAMGLLLGWLCHRTDSLAPCVLAHAEGSGFDG